MTGYRPLLAGLVLGLVATQAGAFRAENGLDVNPLPGPATFEVIQSRGAGPMQFWCAAADYARRELNGDASDRVVLTEPRHAAATDPRREGVSFRLVAREARQETTGRGFATVREAGETYSVSMAENLCRVDQPDRGDIWTP